MRSRTLHVTLNPSGTPPVNVVEGNLSVGKHRYQITWVPAKGQSGWTFNRITQGDKQSQLTDPPFSNVTVSDAQISLQDDNKDPDDHGSYSYAIEVESGGSYYWSDPEIINKGGN